MTRRDRYTDGTFLSHHMERHLSIAAQLFDETLSDSVRNIEETWDALIELLRASVAHEQGASRDVKALGVRADRDRDEDRRDIWYEGGPQEYALASCADLGELLDLLCGRVHEPSPQMREVLDVSLREVIVRIAEDALAQFTHSAETTPLPPAPARSALHPERHSHSDAWYEERGADGTHDPVLRFAENAEWAAYHYDNPDTARHVTVTDDSSPWSPHWKRYEQSEREAFRQAPEAADRTVPTRTWDGPHPRVGPGKRAPRLQGWEPGAQTYTEATEAGWGGPDTPGPADFSAVVAENRAILHGLPVGAALRFVVWRTDRGVVLVLDGVDAAILEEFRLLSPLIEGRVEMVHHGDLRTRITTARPRSAGRVTISCDEASYPHVKSLLKTVTGKTVKYSRPGPVRNDPALLERVEPVHRVRALPGRAGVDKEFTESAKARLAARRAAAEAPPSS
ncbi:hypothetical protein ACIQUL_29600 [Streptomyces sp. NPDC090303]|uniref:hypothetical protein n=1 Tax=Streptomyces sp. NPDC090303 TaxID=3365960 RepID=UPI0038058571